MGVKGKKHGRPLVRRQHTVSKFYLKGFADDTGQLVRVPMDGGSGHTANCTDATVIKDFYSLNDENGRLDDFFETEFAKVEERAAVALRGIVNGVSWPLPRVAKVQLSRWIALQYLRTPAIRDEQTAQAGEMIRLIVGVSGKAALREHIERASGESVSDAQLDAEWSDITAPGGPTMDPDTIGHIRLIVELLPGTTEMFASMQWSLDLFDDQALITGDHPVVLLPDPSRPSQMGTGLVTAGGYAVNLTRRIALVIGASPGSGDTRGPGTPRLARVLNIAAIANANRAVLHHPDDAPLMQSFQLPTGSRRIARTGADQFIKEEGLFSGLSPDQLASMSVGHDPEEGNASIGLADLGWPIEGRRFMWVEPDTEPF